MAGNSATDWVQIDADFGEWAGVIHFQPFLSYRHREMFKKASDESHERGMVEFLMIKAHDENHQRLWRSAADRDKILDEFNPHELDRVTVAMSRAVTEVKPGN